MPRSVSRKLLAVETSTSVCSVALLTEHQLYEVEETGPNQHSQTLLPMIQQLLQDADLHLSELDAIAVGQGPGSFTGIRIGIAAVQGLAFAAGLPVIPVSSLASMATQAQLSKVLVAIDARMQQVYWGRYQIARTSDGVISASLLDQEYVSDPEQMWVPQAPGWSGVGDAWAVHASRMGEVTSKCDNTTEDCRPTAAATARLALCYFKAGKALQPSQIEPAYLRNKVARKSKSSQQST